MKKLRIGSAITSSVMQLKPFSIVVILGVLTWIWTEADISPFLIICCSSSSVSTGVCITLWPVLHLFSVETVQLASRPTDTPTNPCVQGLIRLVAFTCLCVGKVWVRWWRETHNSLASPLLTLSHQLSSQVGSLLGWQIQMKHIVTAPWGRLNEKKNWRKGL